MWSWIETRLGTICCRFGGVANEVQCKCMCVVQLSAAQSLSPACQTCPMLPFAETTWTHFLVQRLLLLSLKALLKLFYTSFHPEILHPIHNITASSNFDINNNMAWNAFVLGYDENGESNANWEPSSIEKMARKRIQNSPKVVHMMILMMMIIVMILLLVILMMMVLNMIH